MPGLPVSVRNDSEWLEGTWRDCPPLPHPYSQGRLSDTNAGNFKVHGMYSKGSHVYVLLTCMFCSPFPADEAESRYHSALHGRQQGGPIL